VTAVTRIGGKCVPRVSIQAEYEVSGAHSGRRHLSSATLSEESPREQYAHNSANQSSN
jgi:hypothetical protein